MADRVHVTLKLDVEPFLDALAKVQRTLDATNTPAFRAFLKRLAVHHRHHPTPLCIDGHDYHRRRRARKRRNR